MGGDDLLDVHDPVHHRGQGGGGALKWEDIATLVSKDTDLEILETIFAEVLDQFSLVLVTPRPQSGCLQISSLS